MQTGIIIKTPDDKKKGDKNHSLEPNKQDEAGNNINIMIYEGPPRDKNARKQWNRKSIDATPDGGQNDNQFPTPNASNA